MNPEHASSTRVERVVGWLKEEFQPGILIKSITSGMLIYLMEIIIVLSFSALIFSGELADQLPYGISLIVLGDALLVGTVALLSSYRGMIAVEQDAPGAILAIASLSMMAAMPANSTSFERLATILITIIGTTLLTGLLFILLGVFKLGGLVRFLPYPVIGGFLAGTGWLLLTGGLSFMVDSPLNTGMFQPDLLSHWLPGFLLGVVMLVAANRIKNPLVLPGLIAAAVGLFYVSVSLFSVPLAFLQEEGWLLGTFPSGGVWRPPLSSDILAQVNWRVLWQHLPTLLALPLISVVALLLNTNGIELAVKKEVKLSHELIITGIGNLVGGLVGGITGYAAISLTTLNHTMNGGKRLPGLVAAALIGSTAFAGIALLPYIPKMVLGGLLVYLGLEMLVEWIYRAWFKFPRVDFLIILTILGIVAVSGFLPAVAVGLVMTIILFAINYSQINVVKFTLSGTSYRSRVTRERASQAFLTAEGDQLYILKLQGFIFFGTANSLLEQVRGRVRSASSPRIRFALLDFSQVTGLDSTGLLSFSRLLEFTQDQEIVLILTGLHGRLSDQFTKGGFVEKPGALYIFPDLDHGTEWCEEQILSSARLDTGQNQTLVEQLETIWSNTQQISKLVEYMQRHEISPGQYLIHQGDDPNFIYLVESGQLTAQLEKPGQPPVRLETMRGGRAVGELGFYLGTARAAAVVADEPSVVYAISQSEMEAIEQNDPEAAYVFHRIIVHLMGERIVHLIRAVNALQDG